VFVYSCSTLSWIGCTRGKRGKLLTRRVKLCSAIFLDGADDVEAECVSLYSSMYSCGIDFFTTQLFYATYTMVDAIIKALLTVPSLASNGDTAFS
jgi:hypothetical protein